MSFERMLRYTEALRAHNDRTWFHETHDEYLRARSDFLALLEQLRFVIADASPEIGGDILYMNAKDWVYRIARDMRYYKNRPPYDPSFRAYISADRKSWLPIGYFLCVERGNTVFGTGMFLEETAAVNRVRDFIAANQEEWEAILEENDLPFGGDMLKSLPRGYSPDHPAAKWLRYKNWLVEYAFPDESLDSFDDFAAEIGVLVRRTEPFRKFLLEAGKAASAPKAEIRPREIDFGW